MKLKLDENLGERGRQILSDSCPDFHAGEIDFLRLLGALGFAPRLEVKLHRLAKIPLGGGQSPALS